MPNHILDKMKWMGFKYSGLNNPIDKKMILAEMEYINLELCFKNNIKLKIKRAIPAEMPNLQSSFFSSFNLKFIIKNPEFY